MSAGKFQKSRYVTDEGDVVLARVQPETLTPWNPASAAAADFGISANLTGGQRQNGVNARYVLGTWQAGAAPAGYEAEGQVRIPVLLKASFDAITKGDTLAYLGGTFEVTGKVNEKLV